MKRNYTFSKYKIKLSKNTFNFIDIFSKGDKNDKSKIDRVKTLLNNKIKIIPNFGFEKSNNQIKQIKFKKNNTPNQFNIVNNISKQNKNNKIKVINNDINNIVIESKKSDEININNSNQKKKTKQLIPINKNQSKPFQNINQNYVININNNINNSYQIKMQNNRENIKENNNKNNYDFEKMKIIPSEEGNKNYNSSNQKTILTELSDLSCFKSNQKTFNLNSINSFPNNDNDLLSFSDDTNLANNLKNNNIQENQNNSKNNDIKKKKIYINPIDFQNFCKEIEEKLNL